MTARARRLAAPYALLAAALFASACSPQPQAPPRNAALVGAWRSSVRFDSGPFKDVADLEFMYVFQRGGTLTESSNYDAAPPVPPAYGIWRRVGRNEFEATYEFFTTQAPAGRDDLAAGLGWVPAGRGRLHEKIRIAADGSSFTSQMTYEVFDARGNPAEGGGTASGRGVRLRF